MNSRQYRTALRLAAMASDARVTYQVARDAQVVKDYYTWYPVTAVYSDGSGRSHPYLLRAEWGAYVGSHTQEYLQSLQS